MQKNILYKTVLALSLALCLNAKTIATENHQDFITNLPKDIKKHVFSFTDLSTLSCISLLNKPINNFLKDNKEAIVRMAIHRYINIKEQLSCPLETKYFPEYCRWVAMLNKFLEKQMKVKVNESWFDIHYHIYKEVLYRLIHHRNEIYPLVDETQPVNFFEKNDQLFTVIEIPFIDENPYFKKNDESFTAIEIPFMDENPYFKKQHEVRPLLNNTEQLNLSKKNDGPFKLFEKEALLQLIQLNFRKNFSKTHVFEKNLGLSRIPFFFVADHEHRISTLLSAIEKMNNIGEHRGLSLFRKYLEKAYQIKNDISQEKMLKQLADIVTKKESENFQLDLPEKILLDFLNEHSALNLNDHKCPLSVYRERYTFNKIMRFFPITDLFIQLPTDFTLHNCKLVTHFEGLKKIHEDIKNMETENISELFLRLDTGGKKVNEKNNIFEKVVILELSQKISLKNLPDNLTQMRLLLIQKDHLNKTAHILNNLEEKNWPKLQAIVLLNMNTLTREACQLFDQMKQYKINVLFQKQNDFILYMSVKDFDQEMQKLSIEKQKRKMEENAEQEERELNLNKRRRIEEDLVQYYKENGWHAAPPKIIETLDPSINKFAFCLQAKYKAFPNGAPQKMDEKN